MKILRNSLFFKIIYYERNQEIFYCILNQIKIKLFIFLIVLTKHKK